MSDKHANWAAQDPVEPEDPQLGLNACAEIANLNNHLSMPGRRYGWYWFTKSSSGVRWSCPNPMSVC